MGVQVAERLGRVKARAAGASPCGYHPRVAPLRPLAIALLLAGTPALGAPRIAPRLRLVVEGRAPARELEGSDGRIAVSVRLDGASVADLVAAGFDVRPGAGSIAFARVTPDELRRLAAHPRVRALEPSLRLRPSLDRSAPLTGAPAARASLGLDGRGTLVGVVDTGCDLRHPDLRTPDGHSRVVALLDLAHARDGRHADLPDYAGGRVFFGDEIDAWLAAEESGMTPTLPVDERDLDGHGTHVLGIAAGNGSGTGNGLPAGRYVGMAPGASIACVEAARDGHGFSEEDVVASVRFVADRAQALGLPVAINLSLSGEGGPHDGSTNFEEALAALAPSDGAGRVLVVAAGNDGGRDLHAGGDALDGHLEIATPFPTDASTGEAIDLDLWFSGAPPSVTLVAPDGHAFGPVASGGKLDDSEAAGSVTIDNASAGVDPLDGRWESYLQVRGASGAAPAGGTWKLVFDGKVDRWDAWLLGVPVGAAEPRFADHLDEDGRAETPAFTRPAITVGSFVSRNEWTNRDGMPIARSTVVGLSSSFSGTGPTADGRFLPDLAAPGEFIASTLSRDAAPELCTPACAPNPDSVFFVAGTPAYLWADDGVHGVLRGTSQAAPHVTGAAALLFQLDPTLTAEAMRELLRASARPAAGEPGYSTREGFGRLDVLGAAGLLQRNMTGAADAAQSSVGVSRDALAPSPSATVLVSVVPRDAAGAPLGPGHTVAIQAWDDRTSYHAPWSGPTRDAGWGRYERELRADGPLGAALAVNATVDGVAISAHPTVWLVASRDDIGSASSDGGCAVGGRGAAPWLALAIAAALALRPRRR